MYALSRQYEEEAPSNPDIILPSSCVMAAVTWEIESLVREAQYTQPDNGLLNRLFVPDSVCSQVLQWGHTCLFACHAGIGCTLSLLSDISGGPPWMLALAPLCLPVLCVCTRKSLSQTTCWAASSPACPWSSLDSHCTGLHH